jgi:hypothetical protein
MGAYPSWVNGRARVDPRMPVAFAICDRCGFRYNRPDLTWQYEWAGNTLQNLRILVCDRCLDVPNEQLRSYSPPADPLPVQNSRIDLSYEGNAPVVVTTAIGTASVFLQDGYGNLIADGYGNPIIVVQGTYGTLISADPTRTAVDFALPASFGLWLNPIGGDPSPLAQGSVFYAPGSVFTATGTAATYAITYYTTISGLTVVVQTQ